jgi:phosphoribosylglycinamide formyltransferase-1
MSANATETLRIGVLASGTGSNFTAIADAIERGEVPAQIVCLVSNRPEAGVLSRAAERDIPSQVLNHRDFASRELYDSALADTLQSANAQLVVLAGFDRLITGALLGRFPDKVINIHPALLPSFKGLDAQRQASAYGVRISGATVHFVDEDLDHGPIIVQAAVAADPFEPAEALAARILEQEHRIYPLAVKLFAQGRLKIEGRCVRILDERRNDSALVNPQI